MSSPGQYGCNKDTGMYRDISIGCVRMYWCWQTQRFNSGSGEISLTPEFDMAFVVVHKYGRFEGFIYLTDDVKKVSRKRVADFIVTYLKISGSS